MDVVRQAYENDIDAIADLHQDAFVRQRESAVWVRATVAAWPRMLVYVLHRNQNIVGYVFWAQKSGLRSAAVVELDQIAIRSDLRGQGLGERLIRESLAQVKSVLEDNAQSLKSIIVSTRADNEAQRLYEKVLGAKVVASIENLYSATEVLMVAKIADA